MTHPIVQRELFSFLRTRRAVALQLGLAAVFAVLVLLHWPTDAQVDLSGARSRDVFRVFGYGLLAALVLLGPIFPATSIVRERIGGTLQLLLNSPMRPWCIYFGKLCGILGLVLVLLAMTVPAAAACYTMGGISFTSDLLALYGLLLLVILQYAAVGLLVSSYASSTDSAVRITYGVVLVLSVIVLGPHQILQGSGGIFAAAAAWLRCISPVPAFLELLGQRDVGSQGFVAAGSNILKYVVLAIVSTAGMMAWTIARLNQNILDRPRPQGKITNELSTSERLFRRLMFLVDPQRRSWGIPRFVNPVMVKEFRCRKFGRMHWLIRLTAVCAMLSLGLTCLTTFGTIGWDVETIGAILVVMQVALIVLVAPSLAVGLISSERESGGWDLLRMTPLRTHRILIGKLASVAWPLLLILLATLPGYIVLFAVQPAVDPNAGLTSYWELLSTMAVEAVENEQLRQVLVCLLLTACFGMLLSAAVGSLFRRTATATVTAYSLLLLVYAGTMLVWLGRDFPFSHSTVEAALIANPMAAAFSAIEIGGFQKYDLLPGNWWFLGIASAAMLAVLVAQTWRLTRPL
jgi:ABC-type transport system involved in multi-copper enzyme maturation permease subunit